MNRIKLIILSSFFFVMSGCTDFEELELNQNKPSQVPASLVLRGVLADFYERPWSLEHRQNQFWCCNYNYYGTNEYWTNASLNFLTLKNVIKMEEEAAKSRGEGVNPYSALGKFFRAYFYVRMTNKVGDLPLDEALQGADIPSPAYATQKEVYLQVLNWLEEANTELGQLISSGDNTLQGDFFYNNDLAKWRKMVNTYKLRVLIGLSKKESDGDLSIRQKFSEVIGNPSKYPIFGSNDDNMNYNYNGISQLYPLNPGNRGFDKGRYNMAGTYLNTLASLNDPRAYVVANPAEAQIAAGVDPTDFAAYVGAPSGESLDDMTFKAGNGEYSFASQKRYYTTFTGPEPGVVMAYWELCFNIAEAINRGWISGNAAAYYEEGIRSSMSFYGIEDGVEIPIYEPDADIEIGSATVSVSAYLSQPDVAYAGNNTTGLEQILTQKYLAFFQNSGLEAYYNYRRTGVPDFHEGPGTGNSDNIPRRWLYPTSELFNNEANLNDALQRQFGGTVDDVDNELWMNQ